MKIVFMGTPDLAKESLQNLYEAGHEIIGVVTNPDRPKGRGMKMVASPVKEYAIEKGFTVYQPEKVKENLDFLQQIAKLEPDLICAVAYGKILPNEILEIPKYGCVNLHFSLLPKYRGAAPIHWPILNGENVTGVTTIYMDQGMDSGDIILQKEVSISADETTGELWNNLSGIGAKVLVETVALIEQGNAPRAKQSSEYTLAPMLYKQMGEIDWKVMKAKQIKDLVRGLNPMMGAYTNYEDKKLKFWKVEIVNEPIDETVIPGKILLADAKKGLYIQAMDAIISVLEIQGENARRMDIGEFLRGIKLEVEKILD